MKTILLFLSIVAGIGSAHSATPKLDQLRIFYQLNPNQAGSPRSIIAWDMSKKICRTRMQEDSSHPWVQLAPGKCEAIRAFLTKNWDELEKRSRLNLDARGRAHFEGEHIPLAEIQFSNVKLGVIAHQTESCDVSMTHCEPSSKDPADQLGYLTYATLAAAFVNR